MKTWLASALILFGFNTVFASGGYSCSAHDSNIDFEASGGLSHGMPGMPFNNSGRLHFSDPSLSIYDIPKMAGGPAMFWANNKDLKLNFYKEDYSQTVYRTMNMLIETVSEEEPNGDIWYKGSYKIELNLPAGPAIITGEIKCTVE